MDMLDKFTAPAFRSGVFDIKSSYPPSVSYFTVIAFPSLRGIFAIEVREI